MIVLYCISALQIRQGTRYHKQWTLLAMLLSYLYQQLGSCQHYRSYPLLLYPYPMLSVFTICCISGPLTVLTNMLCYTSLCTSSMLGTSLSFLLQVYSFSFCFTMPRPARNRGLPKAVNPASMELGQLLALPRQTLVLFASARHLVTGSKARLAKHIHAFEHTIPPATGPIADTGANTATPTLLSVNVDEQSTLPTAFSEVQITQLRSLISTAVHSERLGLPQLPVPVQSSALSPATP